jgi:predicted DNA-binding ribbon-helix-helix protein
MLRKRSVSINGHGTSFSVEDPFFEELKRLARMEGKPLSALVAEIDGQRPDGSNLSSAIRLYVLEALRTGR